MIIPTTLRVIFNVIRLLQAFSSRIFRTVVQQLTKFQLTERRAVPLRQLSFLLVLRGSLLVISERNSELKINDTMHCCTIHTED